MRECMRIEIHENSKSVLGIWVVLQIIGSLFRVLLIRVPYYIGDPKRDPALENYPDADMQQRVCALGFQLTLQTRRDQHRP